MDTVDNKSDKDLIQSLMAEIAKSRNEINCAKKDIEKVNNRIAFALVLLNTLLERKVQVYQD